MARDTSYTWAFGATMRDWRYDQRLTQKAAAARIGRHASEWARWERGEVMPEYRTHQQIRSLIAGEYPEPAGTRVESGRPRMPSAGPGEGQP